MSCAPAVGPTGPASRTGLRPLLSASSLLSAAGCGRHPWRRRLRRQSSANVTPLKEVGLTASAEGLNARPAASGCAGSCPARGRVSLLPGSPASAPALEWRGHARRRFPHASAHQSAAGASLAGSLPPAPAAIKDVADKMTSDELEHLVTLQMMGNNEITGKYLSSLQDKYAPDAASNPNIGKDLTDEQKKELGGSGSGTGTPPPPPPENDPKQQNEKPVEKLNQKQESAIKKIDNTIKNALKDHDITGTLKDMDGNPVPKENGGYWDHMKEMQNTLRGLRNHADTLKNVNNPEAQAAYGRATDAINKIESALKGHGI